MPTVKQIKYLLINALFPNLLYYLFSMYAKTLRVTFEGEQKLQKHLEDGGKVVISSWHQKFFGGFYLPRIFAWSPCIMISQSRDGDFISKVVQRIGWILVRGSGSRGGREALQIMVRGVMQYRVRGHIVDGPTGPPCIIKPGLILLARAACAAICPGIVSYENAWTAHSWDRFMIPKPSVGCFFGSAISIPCLKT
jgi:hypothetical protein